MKRILDTKNLCTEAGVFARIESKHGEPSIFGVDNGKAIGTYFEHKFNNHLENKYTYEKGGAAKGIDFPDLGVDMKVTSIKQPQSSCPFTSARQKIFGLGYSLLVFVYDKTDDTSSRTGNLNILHAIFVEKERTADFQTTSGLRKLLVNNANADDLISFMHDRYLPLDDIQARELAEEILNNPPVVGYLTISNALQWRLQYSRIIEQADKADGLRKIV